MTKLPFKPDHDLLPDNYEICKNRLINLKKLLIKDKTLSQYKDIFLDYEKQGIIEKVPLEEIPQPPGKVHYLAQRSVIRSDRETTKIRAVFDASCSNSGPSLNDCLYSGPNLLGKIFDILLRFRLNYISILADIQQAFLNIEISTEHTDFLRFLWYDFRNTDVEKIIVLRFLRVVFGLTSSPFLLNGTIRHHLLKYEKSHPVFLERFLKDIYVDDSTSGAETVNEGKKFYVTAKSILSAAGLNLRKWVTNDEDLQQFFDQNENAKSDIDSNQGDDVTFLNSQLKFEENKSKSVLGVEWKTKPDEFVFPFSNLVDQAKSLETTKKNVLKISASFYDPLGMISLVTSRVKTIFQLLCQDKLNWDDTVPWEIEIIWNEFISNLEEWGGFKGKTICIF